jgi:ATP-dependent Clp protease ATP-binding subunit ClpB
MNSVPEPIDDLDSRIRQLEIEREAIKREGVSMKMDRIDQDLKDLNAQRDVLMKKWKEEKNILSGLQEVPKDYYEAASIDGASGENRGLQNPGTECGKGR